jgi:hypothetical protein
VPVQRKDKVGILVYQCFKIESGDEKEDSKIILGILERYQKFANNKKRPEDEFQGVGYKCIVKNGGFIMSD